MRVLGATVLLSCTLACGRGETSEPPLTPASGTMTPASRTTPAAERAIQDITRARCDRAERCGEVGLKALFYDRQHCLNALWDESVAQLTPCRSGVDQDAVQECLAEINEHGCEDAMGGFNQYETCSVDQLCL